MRGWLRLCCQPSRAENTVPGACPDRTATRISPDGDLAASSGATAHLVLAATDTRGATHRDPPSSRLAGWRRPGRTSANGHSAIRSLFSRHLRRPPPAALPSTPPPLTALPP